jgi:hypothetical protein
MAEFEIRRLSRKIEKLDDHLTSFRHSQRIGSDTYVMGWGRPAQAIESIEIEIAETEKRLRALISEPELP